MYVNIPSQYDVVSMAKLRNVKNVMKRICATYVDSRKKHFESPHNKINKMTFVPSEDSDPPGHTPV